MKYEEPKITIESFDIENIITVSSANTENVFEEYGKKDYSAVKAVDVGAVMGIAK